MKNLIYIIAIDGENSKNPASNYAQYSLPTWEFYCKQYGIDLIVQTENVGKFEFPIWNKESIYEVGKEYDKIGIVDCDTMVKWDAPNIFERIEDKFYGVNDLCDLNWLLSSIQQRQKFFPEVKLDLMKYLNAGVLFFSNKHLEVFRELLDFYRNHQEEIHAIDGGGKEQTLLNFILQKNEIAIDTLSPSWNLISIHRKNMFAHNWQLKQDLTSYFVKYANIWHFTGFPIEQRVDIMRQVWEAYQRHYEF